MTGWKTKFGAFLLSIGGLCVGSTQVVPVQEWIPWLKFGGFVISGFGTAFTAWGIGHKIEKTKE